MTCVNGSGGVITAARINMIRIAYIRHLIKSSALSIPILETNNITRGSWKTTPSASVSIVTSEIYWLIVIIGCISPPSTFIRN